MSRHRGHPSPKKKIRHFLLVHISKKNTGKIAFTLLQPYTANGAARSWHFRRKSSESNMTKGPKKPNLFDISTRLGNCSAPNKGSLPTPSSNRAKGYRAITPNPTNSRRYTYSFHKNFAFYKVYKFNYETSQRERCSLMFRIRQKVSSIIITIETSCAEKSISIDSKRHKSHRSSCFIIYNNGYDAFYYS